MKSLRSIFVAVLSLIGVSFVAFLVVGPGSAAEATEPGSEDPILVQYGRWLVSACPIQTGSAAQVLPSGERVREPLDLPDPSAWMWFRAAPPRPLPSPSPSPGRPPNAAGASIEQKQAAYTSATKRFNDARLEYLRQRDALDRLLVAYIQETRIKNALTPEGRPRTEVLAPLRPNTSLLSWQGLMAQADTTVLSMEAAQSIAGEIADILATGPYPQDGFAIIPGTLSIAFPDLGFSRAEQRPVLGLVVRALGLTTLMALAALACIRALHLSPVASRLIRFVPLPCTLAIALAAGILLGPEYLGALPGPGLHSAGAESLPLFPFHEGSEGLNPGYVLDALWHLILPVGCLACVGAVLHTRSIPALPTLLFASAVVEAAFDFPGIGRALLHAIQAHDRGAFTGGAVAMWIAVAMSMRWRRGAPLPTT